MVGLVAFGLELDVAGQVDRLQQHEGAGDRGHAEGVEADPDIGVEAQDHEGVRGCGDDEVDGPGDVQLVPDLFRQRHAAAQELRDQVAARDVAGADQGGGEQAADHGRLPHDEGIVVEDQGGAAEQHDQHHGDHVRGLEFSLDDAEGQGLDEAGAHQHGGSRIDAGQLEGGEEQQDRK